MSTSFNREVNLQDFKPSLDELRALIKKMQDPKEVEKIVIEAFDEFNQETKDEE